MKNYLQRQVLRAKLRIRQLLKKDISFQPYVKEMDIQGIQSRFFFATSQASEWYDPLKPYAKLEYEWVIQNIPLKNQAIIDAGAHHGQYSVVFALGAEHASQLISVDPHPMNCLLTEINLLLNQAKPQIEQSAVAGKSGTVHFADESNGRIIQNGGMVVNAKTLSQILPNVNVIKLDVEGAEFEIIPQSIAELNAVHTWIVEIHPQGNAHPDTIIKEFWDRDYKVLYINRNTNSVEPYKRSTIWNIHSTIFASKA